MPVNGGYDVYELYGETRIPLVQDLPFAKDITAELAYRSSDYSNAGVTHTYKIAGDWTPIDGLRFRGGYNRAVRAPNVVELFSPPTSSWTAPSILTRASGLATRSSPAAPPVWPDNGPGPGAGAGSGQPVQRPDGG